MQNYTFDQSASLTLFIEFYIYFAIQIRIQSILYGLIVADFTLLLSIDHAQLLASWNDQIQGDREGEGQTELQHINVVL